MAERATRSLFDPAPVAAGFRDSAFATNKSLPLHRWVPWIAVFSSEFVDDCLDRYLPPERTSSRWVLDPFAGVGTTLVQAYAKGFNVIGFEINPYAALATKLKLEAGSVSTKQLTRHISDFREFMCHKSIGKTDSARGPKNKAPTGFSGRTQLFNSKVERQVLFALDFMESIREQHIRDLFRLALGSVMVSFSNYSYEPSLTRRSTVGKPDVGHASVGEVIGQKLGLMLEDIVWLQDHLTTLTRKPKSSIIADSIFSALDTLGDKSFIDLAVTSPPYLNNYHYPRNTRPQVHWLGFASGPGYNGARELESFGKFWQTVRSLPAVPLAFKMQDLETTIDSVRQVNPDKGSYGGSGWANYVATYFNDTHRFCRILSRLLRPGARAVIVLGNSIIQGVEVKTDHLFGRIAEGCGLEFQDPILLRKKRTGTSIINSSVRVEKVPRKTVLYESAIILRKPTE